MIDLQTKYMGLSLKSPIIAGSCGLTADVDKMVELEQAGVGAVVLKSIFEEQILEDSRSVFESGFDGGGRFAGAADYINAYIHSHAVKQHVDLVREAKSRLTIPVIASINCFSKGEWMKFARELQDAGADALELNVFMLPTDEFQQSADIENQYFQILKDVKKHLTIPVAMKIGRYFTNLSAFVDKLKAYGAGAVTIFNRFYEPDIDIDKLEMGIAPVFSTPVELRTTLRWTGILAGKDNLQEISATTGVHSGEAVVKLILAGATTVQVCSVLYEKGVGVVREMNDFLAEWMNKKGFENLEEARGLLSYGKIDNPELYERAQFMRYFSNKK